MNSIADPWTVDPYDHRARRGIGNIFGDAADWLSGAVDTLEHLPVIKQALDLLPDSVKTALLHILAVATMTELFSALPGIGQIIGSTLATLGPVASDMLPGLARGERVDRVFVASLKTVVARAAAAGGGDAAGRAMSDALPAASQVVKDRLAELGISPAQIAAETDRLRVASGLRVSEDMLPAQAQVQLDAYVDQYARQLDTKALAAIAGVKPALMQVAIDGALRRNDYDPSQFTDAGDYVYRGAVDARRDRLVLGPTVNAKKLKREYAALFGPVNRHEMAAARVLVGAGVEPAPVREASPEPEPSSGGGVMVAAAGGVALLGALWFAFRR